MNKMKGIPLMVVLLHLSLFCSLGALKQPDSSSPNRNLTCYNDYNRIITCEWTSTYGPDHMDTVCTLHAEMGPDRASCELKPVDVSRPALHRCALDFEDESMFQSDSKVIINLTCVPGKESVIISYWPYYHVKVNPPGKPDINFTTVSWAPAFRKYVKFNFYETEVQWKQQNQTWREEPTNYKSQCKRQNQTWREEPTGCRSQCKLELEPDCLTQGERYEARARVRFMEGKVLGIWSEWSPTASWVSPVGGTDSPPDVAVGGVNMIVVMVSLLALFLMVGLFMTDKTTWVVKRIRGAPLPNPKNSFLRDVNLQTWLSPHFSSESFHSFLKPVEVVSVELTSAVDAVTPCRPDVKLMENKVSYEAAGSGFSNVTYSELFVSPAVPLLTAGNLEPCVPDTPYGPVGNATGPQQSGDNVREKEEEILKLLCGGDCDSERLQVVSDYEKAEKPPVEWSRLQSLDSGMCSCEEVSQDSMEADSINVSHDEEAEGEEQREGGDGEGGGEVQQLFRTTGGVFGKDCIPVCSDYERVQTPQPDSPELPSLDSGVGSGGEELVSPDESLEEVDQVKQSTRFQFPPQPSTISPCSLQLSFSGPGLPPLQSGVLERSALMSSSRSVEPSGDGYMPVKQALQ